MKTALQVGSTSVSISNIDKVLFPESGTTKGQVIDYYVKMSPFILPHLKMRPLTMKRFPEGVEGP